jgi:formimidoylglutamate deiminase
MYAVATALDPDTIEAISALAFLEMAEAGITRVGEFHYVHHQSDGTQYDDPDLLARRVIAAALRVGIRICLLRVAYVRGGHGVALSSRQARFVDPSMAVAVAAAHRLADGCDARVSVGLAPHSVRAVGRADLEVAAGWTGVVHAHVSEQDAENESCFNEYGCSPTALLDEVGLLSGRFTAVHLTRPLPGDVERLLRSNARVCVCPTTELDLGDGFLPIEAMTLPLCVGSDSHAAIDPWLEARSIELHARGLARRRNVLAPLGDRHGLASRILGFSTVEGDRALGGQGSGIVQGAPADLVAIDLRQPAAIGVPPLEAAAFVSSPQWVDRVWVAGELVVEGGRHPSRDVIVADARSAIEKVLALQ